MRRSVWLVLGAGCAMALAVACSNRGAGGGQPPNASGTTRVVIDGVTADLYGDFVTERLAGQSTSFKDQADAYSFSARNMGSRDDKLFARGTDPFVQPWVVAPGDPPERDGLGPFYAADACGSCHLRHGRGAPPLTEGETLSGDPTEAALGLLIRMSVPGAGPHGEPLGDPVYGDQLQDHALAGLAPEGQVQVAYTDEPGQFGDGTGFTLRRPRYTVTDLAYGPLAPGVQLSPRLAPIVVGEGLLEAIPEQDLLAAADPYDRDGDGIRGRVNRVWDVLAQRQVIGRFGWKAGQPSVQQQTAFALAGDMGITSPLVAVAPCPTPATAACARVPSGAPAGGAEAEGATFDELVFYTRMLAVPAMRDTTDPQVRKGAEEFVSIGCAACHTPTQHTASGIESGLADQTIHPYTDLLVHDLGDGLADGRPEYAAGGRDWRTAPLWGLGLTGTVGKGKAFYLHDGRARTLSEAILWHGGEGWSSRERYRQLSAADRAALERFLLAL